LTIFADRSAPGRPVAVHARVDRLVVHRRDRDAWTRPRPGTTLVAMSTPLLVTRDPTLHDEVARLAAAAGVSVHPEHDAVAALVRWTAAPLVIAGTDLGEELAAMSPPRRRQVLLVGFEPMAEGAFRTAVGIGAEAVVALPARRAWLTEVLIDLGDAEPTPGTVVGVVAGSGGAGATTFACALAQVAARSGSAVVVDADPLGPGADRVLGLDGAAGVRWGDLGQTTGRLGARSLREALPSREGLRVLTWETGTVGELSAPVVRETLSAARRGHSLVVVDLGRSPDPLLAEVGQRCDALVVVARATVASAAATARAAARFAGHPRVSLVARGPETVAEEVASATGLPLLAAMPDQRGLTERVDLGLGPVRGRRGPLARTARTLLEHLGVRAA
jgi:secretion/DNA translocation related CpaE-like protein